MFWKLPPGAYGAGVPANDWGYQEALDGNAYAGFLTYFLPNSNYDNIREYIAIELNQSLVAGKEYYWCMYVSLTDSVEYYSNNIGIALLDNKYIDSTIPHMLLEFSVNDNWDDPISDFVNWTQIGGSFIAKGGEKYFYIGNFFKDEETEVIEFQQNDRGGPSAAYYIDNVYLGTSPCIEPSIKFPNIFTPNKDGVNDLYRTNDQGLIDKEMTIINRWGNVVYEGKGDNGWDGINKYGKECHEGVYFVKVTFTNPVTNKKETKTGYVHLIR